MNPITFFAAGEPKAQPRPRAFYNKNLGQARIYNPSTAEAWKSDISNAARFHKPEQPIAGAVALEVVFYMPRPKGHYRTGKHAGELHDWAPARHVAKPDFDNLAKCVADVLTTLGFLVDDGQISDTIIRKRYAQAGRMGAQITLHVLPDAAPTGETDSLPLLLETA